MIAVARLGLLPAGCAAWLAALVATAVPPASGWIAGLAAPVAGAALLVRLRRGRRSRPVLQAAVVAAAIAAAGFGVLVRSEQRSALPVGVPLQVTLRVEGATVTGTNDASGGLTDRAVLRGVLTGAVVHGRSVETEGPVLVFAEALPTGARPGAMLIGTGVLSRAAPTDDIAFRLSARGSLRPLPADGDPVQATAEVLRSGLTARVRSLPGDGGALLPGLAIGDTTAVPPSLTAAMKASSLSHLTAVSGANCAVVTAAVFAAAGAVGLPRLAKVVAAGAALVGFVVLVTPQPSVLRSAAMGLVVLGCLAAGRATAGLPALGIAILVLLLQDPWLARDFGFVLSVLATGGLLTLTRPIAARLARVLPERLAVLVAVPIAAQVACQPVLILLQPSLPVFGIAANLLAQPAAPLATVLGLLACLALPAAPPLGQVLAVLGWLPAAWIAAVARFSATLPTLPWLPGATGGALVAGLVLATVLALRRRGRAGPRTVAAVALVVAGLAVLGAWGGAWIGRGARPAEWEVAACDVGQGDGLVLNGGGGHVVVVDTGRRPAPLTACLATLGVGRIDLLVLTHWDADHVTAARSLAGRVGAAFIGPSDGPAADGLRAALVDGGARVEQVRRGQRAQVGRLRLEVLWPQDPLGPTQPGNPASITLLARGRLTSLLTGDIGEEAQDALLAAGTMPAVDVVKVAHHGSADQSASFYRAVAAPVGLVSVGAGNDYGHPAGRALRILADAGTAPVRTDQDGLILVSGSSGGGIRVWTERPVTAAVWRPAK